MALINNEKYILDLYSCNIINTKTKDFYLKRIETIHKIYAERLAKKKQLEEKLKKNKDELNKKNIQDKIEEEKDRNEDLNEIFHEEEDNFSISNILTT